MCLLVQVGKSDGVGWLAVSLRGREVGGRWDEEGRKMEELGRTWAGWQGERSMEAVARLALEVGVRGGKWVSHLPSSSVDAVWARVAGALVGGRLGEAAYLAKVSPVGKPWGKEKGLARQNVMMVYNTDHTDLEEVMGVERQLRAAGVPGFLSYKPDICSALGIYNSNPWGLRPTVFSSHYREGGGGSWVTGRKGEGFYNTEREEGRRGEDMADLTQEKYYHIDKLLKSLIDLNIELNDYKARRQGMLAELEKTVYSVDLLRRSGGGSLALGFLKDCRERQRALVLQVKAVDESLELLQRQYGNTRVQILETKADFLQLQQAAEAGGRSLSPDKEGGGRTFSPDSLMDRDSKRRGEGREAEGETGQVTTFQGTASLPPLHMGSTNPHDVEHSLPVKGCFIRILLLILQLYCKSAMENLPELVF